MTFKAKVYKLGKSGRLAIMLPKEVVVVPGEYDVEIKVELPPEAPVEPVVANLEPNCLKQNGTKGFRC
mgnify:CR=1 FL=1